MSPATIGAVVDEGAAAYFVVAFMPVDTTHVLWARRIGYVTADAGLFFPIDPVRGDAPPSRFSEPGLLRAQLQSDDPREGQPRQRQRGGRDPRCGSGGCQGDRRQPHRERHHRSELPRPHAWRRWCCSPCRRSTGRGADQSVANGLIVRLDANRFVKVWCGDQTGSTHVILDVNGYWR